jgi:hypothetical protein
MKDKAEMAAALSAVVAIGHSIREAGAEGAPAGVLYAACLHVMSLAQFDQILGWLVQGGMVERKGHTVRWVVGP